MNCLPFPSLGRKRAGTSPSEVLASVSILRLPCASNGAFFPSSEYARFHFLLSAAPYKPSSPLPCVPFFSLIVSEEPGLYHHPQKVPDQNCVGSIRVARSRRCSCEWICCCCCCFSFKLFQLSLFKRYQPVSKVQYLQISCTKYSSLNESAYPGLKNTVAQARHRTGKGDAIHSESV